jgi:hypothetical protein
MQAIGQANSQANSQAAAAVGGAGTADARYHQKSGVDAETPGA